MAASRPTEETLNPSSSQPSTPHPQSNGQDSSSQPNEPTPPNPQSTDPIEASDKRKRPDPEEVQKPSPHPLWKTSLCSYFRRSGGSACSHGDSCRYAHGETELRTRPDGTWDPTSERAKKMLKTEDGERVEGSGGVKERSDENDNVMMTEAFVEEEECSEPDLVKCLVNLPMRWCSEKLRSFLGENGILFKSAKKKKGMLVGFVSFENAEQVKSAVEELNGKSVGNKSLKVADVTPRSFEKKNIVAISPSHNTQQNMKPATDRDKADVSESSNGSEDGDPIDDSLMPGSSDLRGRSVRDVVTPLAHLPYVDQLEQKKSSLTQMLKKLTRNARKACPNGVSLPEWILKSKEIGGLPCKLEGLIESPLLNGYRNKCEFSVGYSVQGKPTVGFSLGTFREGVTAIEEPVDCPNVSRIACKYAAVFQEFLQFSGLPIWNRLNNTGFWRQLTVREGRAPGIASQVESTKADISDVLLMVQVCTVGFDDALINSELEKMAEAFVAGASADSLPLTELVLQDHRGISNVAPADAPLRSLPILKAEIDSVLEAANDVLEPRIHDYINNLRFSISPTAFFQVNTLAAEKLYALAGDWAGLGPDTLLFDVCCGTGTIGLTLAHRVGMVVGIEMNASAVSDALRNAQINGIKNCRFVCGKAEDVMGSLLKQYLNLPLKQGEISDTSVKNDDDITTVEEKGTSKENVPGPEKSSGLELEEDESKIGKPELENQLEKISTSENGSTSIQQFQNVVVLVDPPRVGLHPTVIKALRTHPRLRRLVYISCNPESLVANAIELCTPSVDKMERGNKNNKGWRNMSSAGLARHRAKSMPNSEPFKPIRAMAVDLFPHTPHCELVMLLER